MCRKTAIKKLQNENGATLMLALLFFIMCAVAGSIILASATGAAGRAAGTSSDSTQSVTQRKENIQDYYTLTSAADFLVSQIKGKSVMIRKDSVTAGTGTSSDTVRVHLMNSKDPDLSEEDWKNVSDWKTNQPADASLLEEIVYKYALSQLTGPEQETLRISLSSSPSVFKDVLCELDYDNTCGFTARLYTSSAGTQYITVTIPAQIEKYTPRKTLIKDKTGAVVSIEIIDMERISWNSASVSASADIQ